MAQISKKRLMFRFVFGGACIIVWALMLYLLWNQGKFMAGWQMLIFIWLIMIIMNFWRMHRAQKGKIEHDERTKLIAGKSFAYSRMITLLFIWMLFWVDFFEVEITVKQIIWFTPFVMIMSFYGSYFVLSRKGIVD